MSVSRSLSIARPARRMRKLVIGLSLIVLAGAGMAQQPAPVPPGNQPPPDLTPEEVQQLETLRQKRAELMQAKERLDKIQHEAMEADPKLRAQETAFAELVKEEMKGMGRKPDEEVAELRELQQKLQSEELPDAERQQLWGQFQEKAGSFRAAQQRALQTPKVQQAQTELREAVVAAMKARDPETEKLLAQMESTREELKALHQKAMQRQP